MATVIVEAEKVIARPVDVVRAQFMDMEHHAAAGVHADLEVSNVRLHDHGCRFTGRRRVFGRLQEDEIELSRGSDGSVMLRSVAGSNPGLLITQAFDPVGDDRTRVRATVELPVAGILRLLRPLVRKGLERDLAKAFEEDRIDLEERGYPRAG